MNVNTGQIFSAEDFSMMKKLGHDPSDYVEVPDADADKVYAMNRHDRRAWAAQQRKAR